MSPTLSPQLRERLRCPKCTSPVVQVQEGFVCREISCASRFPLVDGIPVLINEDASLFSIDDFVGHRDTFFPDSARNRRMERIKQLLPDVYRSTHTHRNYRRFAGMLEKRSSRRVLVVGGSIVGNGMEALQEVPSIEWVNVDVALGPQTTIVCDGHDLPFADGTFDAAIIQAVLEHVVDPNRVVSELHRVLKPDGLVYSETPFMYPMHGDPYDFTRFTLLGHRRLFRHFEELDAGPGSGPGSAVAMMNLYFLMSCARTRNTRRVAHAVAQLLFGALKELDGLLLKNPFALNIAPGYYFMGRRSEQALPDRELVRQYRQMGAAA